LLPLRSGEGVVLGHDLAIDRTQVRRHVGYLGHASFLYEELTVEENVRFALRASGVGSAEASRRTAGVMARLGLSGRLPATPVVKLSAGQRRRAAIAVVLGRQPRLWLLDEPHAGLDHDARALLDEIVTEARAGGATVVLSSHELGSAGALADRVVHLAGGRVVAGTLAAGDNPPTAVGPAPELHVTDATESIAAAPPVGEETTSTGPVVDRRPETVHVA
jgi:ABC-type multidrug transport system ATPase subunit